MKKRLLLSLLLLSGASAFAQTRVSGVVTSAIDGKPMSGARVFDGNMVVAITDDQGRFALDRVPAGLKKLTISYLGMKSQQVAVASNIEVVLEEDYDLLGEAVIVGSYGSGQKVGSVTGAVAVVSSATIENKPVANIVDAIQGKVAGVNVYTASGEPSATSSVTVRGIGTFNGSTQPLYILDGQMVGAGTVLSINPNDFESVQVLKDASATSIYGSRAANGVIIYTTKRGKRGEAGRIALDLNYSVSNMASTTQYDRMASSSELWQFWKEAGIQSASQLAKFAATYDTLTNTDWRKYFYRENAPTFQGTLSYSGGTQQTDYFVSLGVLDAKGLAFRSGYQRYAFRTALNTTLRPWLTTGFAVSTSLEDAETNPYGGNSKTTGTGYTLNPMFTPYDSTGREYFDELVPGLDNYTLGYRRSKFYYDQKYINLVGNFYFEVRPVKGLRLRTQNSVDGSIMRRTEGRYASHVAAPKNGHTTEESIRSYTLQTTNTAEYKFAVGSHHHFTTLLGHEYSKTYYDAFSAKIEGMEDDRLHLLRHGTGAKTLTQSLTESALLSWIGRLSYDYLERYFVDATLRNDNSSLFAKAKRSGWFFSLGGRWKMKQEQFMQSLDWVNSLDLRLSYGTQGRAAVAINEYKTLVGSNKYQDAGGYYLSHMGNDDMGWETQGQASVGVDLVALDNRLKVTLDLYDKRSNDLLLAVPQPGSKGISEWTRNTASIKNTGVEVSVAYDVFGRDSKWFLEPYMNLSHNKSVVTKLYDEAAGNGRYWFPPQTGVMYAVGEPVSYSMPLWAGVDPATGKPQWYLPGDDPTKTTRDPSRVTTTFSDALSQNTGKKRYPNLTGGFGFNAAYQGVSLQVDFAFALGKYIVNNDKYYTMNPAKFINDNVDRSLIGNYWTPTNTTAQYPSLDYTTLEFDDRVLENASFLRLKNVTLSYTLPKAWLDKTNFFTSARVYLTGRNLLTATSYTGNDPELTSNVAMGNNPQTKQVSVGLSVTF